MVDSLDSMFKKILRDLEKLKNSGASEMPQLVEEIYSFEETLTLTDSAPVMTLYDDREAVIDTAQINRDEVE